MKSILTVGEMGVDEIGIGETGEGKMGTSHFLGPYEDIRKHYVLPRCATLRQTTLRLLRHFVESFCPITRTSKSNFVEYDT